jgi:O-antigen chain-terminating methyltransferase
VNGIKAELGERARALDAHLADARAAHDDLGSRAAKLETAVNGIKAELGERAMALDAHLADARAAHDDLGSRAAKLEAAIRPLERSLALPADDRFYADLEVVFRGAEELIKSRAEVYLPCIKKASAGKPGRPVIDLGCGRGEWLELLKSHNLESIGVDKNNLFVETLRGKNIVAERGDLLEFLQGRPQGSAGAVTGIHILEHLPFCYLLDLLTETTRVLAPGGVAIFETPNPANLPVGAHTFYLDPTHLKPIPPALLAFLVERAGLVNIETIEIHPPPQSALPPADSDLPPELLAHFARPEDYFVVGWKK